MPKVIIELAKESNDEELRRILRENCMSGRIRFSFQREPSFFESLKIEGEKVQVVVGKDIENGNLIGFGIRAIRRLFLNGRQEKVGYLSNLRLNQEYRGRIFLARGYRYFKKLHKDGWAKIYLTSIVEENVYAKEILTSGKGGLPPYRDFGGYITYAIGLKRKKWDISECWKVKRCRKEMLEDVFSFMHREGKNKQFFPYYTPEDLLSKNGLLKGMKVEDIFLVFRNEKIVGTAALWDLTGLKQQVLCGYSPLLKIIRPPWNIFSPLLDLPSLPPEGNKLHFFFVSLITIKNNALEIFHLLMERIRKEGYERKYKFCIVGLHSNDPLNRVMNIYPSFRFRTRIYIVHWEDGCDVYNKIDRRIPYLEVSTL